MKNVMSFYLQGKNDKHCHFKVHVLPDSYVYFESIHQPDTFLAFQSDGNPRKPREVKPTEGDAQFFVRVEVSHCYTSK